MKRTDKCSSGRGRDYLRHQAQTGSVAHPDSYPVGTGAPSLSVKRPGGEADRSLPSGAEYKISLNYTSTPPCIFMAWCLMMHKNNYCLLLNMKLCSHLRIQVLGGYQNNSLTIDLLEDEGLEDY